MKKYNANGFAHQALLLALVVVGVIGGIGSYIYLRSSSAATVTKSSCVSSGGVWVDLRSHGVDHGPCWSTPGAYLVIWGAGKIGDGIDHVPLTGNNAETGTSLSEKFNYPNFLIVVSGKWQACGTPSGRTTCTPLSGPFKHDVSAPYRTSGGGEGYLHGGAYSLGAYDYYWINSTGRYFTNFSTDTGIYLKRL
jgi:hypothetical protein